MLTKEQLDKVLGLSTPKNKLKTTYSSLGPGELDKWRLLQDESDCWIKKQPQELPSTKLIISAPQLKYGVLESFEVDLFKTLIQYYEVYLETDPHKRIETLKPLNHIDDFLHQRHNIKPANKRIIYERLANQNVAANAYFILDGNAYSQVINNAQEFVDESKLENVLKKKSINVLDLEEINLSLTGEFEEYIQGFDISAITAVKLRKPFRDELRKCLDALPHLEKLIITYGDDEWLSNNIDLIADYQVGLHQFITKKTTLAFPDGFKLCELVLGHSLDLKTLECSNLLLLENLKIPELHANGINQCKALKKLGMANVSRSMNLPESLEVLSISNFVNKFPDSITRQIQELKNLKELNLKLRNQTITLGTLQQSIEMLTLESECIITLDYLPYLTNLKYLTISTRTISTQTEFRVPKSVITLDLKPMSDSNNNLATYFFENDKLLQLKNLKHLRLSNFKAMETLPALPSQLESLTIKEMKAKSSTLPANLKNLALIYATSAEQLLNLAPKALEQIEISNCILSSVNFSIFPQLKSLFLNGINNKEVLIVPSTLEHLNLDSYLSTVKGSESLREVTLSKCPNISLTTLFSASLEKITLLTENDFTLDLSSLSSLKSLDVYSKKLSLIINKSLEYLSLSCDLNEELNLAGCNKLLSFELYGNSKFKNLDQSKRLRFVKTEESSLGNFLDNEFCELDIWQSSLASSSRVSSFQQHLKNEQSLTAIYSPQTRMQVDDKTEGLNEVTINGSFKVSMFHPSIFTRHFYHINELDRINIDEEKQQIEFIATPFSCDVPLHFDKYNLKLDIDSLKTKLIKKPDDVFIHLESQGVLQPDMVYELPTYKGLYNADEISIYCNHSDIEFFWDNTKQRAAFRLRKPVSELQFYYVVPLQAKVKQEYVFSAVVSQEHSLLPPFFQQELYKVIATIPALSSLLEESTNLETKMQTLFDYCHDEWQATTLTESSAISWQKLFSIIKERKGVCRHKSQSFMVLSWWLQVLAAIIVNEQHAFCKLPYGDENTKARKFHDVDLGGKSALDLTPLEARSSPFDKLKQISKIDKPLKPTLTSEQQNAYNFFVDSFKQQITEVRLTTLAELFVTDITLSPRIYIDNNNPWDIQATIRSTLLKEDVDTLQHYFYIHDPLDFQQLMTGFVLENGIKKEIPGPLRAFIKDHGVLVINWTTFSADQIANYKSILDDNHPNLLGEDVSKQIRVINLISHDTPVGEDFLSRTRLYILPRDFQVSEEHTKKEKTTSSDDIEIDLFERNTWATLLLGDVNFARDKISWQEGPLFQAIRTSKPCIIYNPPADNVDFDKLLSRLTKERKLYFAGILWQIPESLTFQVKNRPHPIKHPRVSLAIAPSASPNWQNLNNQNWHELFEGIPVNQEQGTISTDRKFSLLNNHDDIFYITDQIPLSEWQYLLHHIEVYYSDRYFNFVLGPGAGIEGVLSAPAMALTKLPQMNCDLHQNIIVSDDPDFTTLSLLKKHPHAHVIDVSLQTKATDLLISLSRVSQTSYQFEYLEKDMLTRLKNNDIVILNGELQPSVFQELLPWLMKKANQLLLVIPRRSIHQYNWQQLPSSHAVTLATYQAEFNNHPAVAKIFTFYEWAKQLPHRGAGRPKAPRINHQRIKMMLNAIDKGGHHNPIKCYFHYDYPNNIDYAYLNVIAKLIFKGEHEKPTVKVDNLAKLINEEGTKLTETLSGSHIWLFLNCFNGAALEKLFGADFSQSLQVQEKRLPQIKSDVLAKLASHPAIKSRGKEVASGNARVLQSGKKPKWLIELQSWINDTSAPMVLFLKGKPGVGKTYSIRQLAKQNNHITLYEGTSKVKDALASYSHDTKSLHILFLDEGNTLEPGSLDFLKGICRKRPANFKIIVAGNTEDVANRHYHEFLQDYSRTILVPLPDATFLEENIIAPHLIHHNLYNAKWVELLIYVFTQIECYNPWIVTSIRDLESLTLRFVCLSKRNPEVDPLHNLLRASIGEFAGSIPDVTQRQRFIAIMQATLLSESKSLSHQEGVIKIANDFYLPPEKHYIKETIEQGIALADMAINTKGYYKQGMILEGASGSGKSTLYKKMLAKLSNCKVQLVSAGSREAFAFIEKAAQDNAWVILDETNLIDEATWGTKLLFLLDQYPNLRVFGSQNRSYFLGRKTLSTPFINRNHMLYMDAYTLIELKTIAAALLPSLNDEELKLLIMAYEEIRSQHRECNARTFFVTVQSIQNNINQLPFEPGHTAPSLQLSQSPKTENLPIEYNDNSSSKEEEPLEVYHSDLTDSASQESDNSEQLSENMTRCSFSSDEVANKESKRILEAIEDIIFDTKFPFSCSFTFRFFHSPRSITLGGGVEIYDIADPNKRNKVTNTMEEMLKKIDVGVQTSNPDFDGILKQVYQLGSERFAKKEKNGKSHNKKIIHDFYKLFQEEDFVSFKNHILDKINSFNETYNTMESVGSSVTFPH